MASGCEGLERFETKEDEGVLARQPGGAEDWDSQWLMVLSSMVYSQWLMVNHSSYMTMVNG